MPIRLGIDHASLTHRFVKALTMEVTADGAAVPEANGSAAGARRFDVPDSASAVLLRITIPSPTGGTSSPLLAVAQSFTVSKTPGAPTLAATGGLHPRLSAIASGGAATKPGGVLRFALDVLFLDTTAHWIAKASSGRLAMTHGTTIRMYECTAGAPTCWAAFVPPAVTATTTDAKLFLFLRPTYKGAAYKNTDDVNGALRESAQRYLRDQDATASTAGPFGLGDASGFPDYGHGCGFERQLVDAGKPVILVWPLQIAASYGDAVSARMPEMLGSLAVAMRDAGVLATASPSTIARLAVGGYSKGGFAALQCFEANRSHIDELYLFDPGTFPASLASATPFGAWLGGKASRRLRMIGGGYQHTRLLAFEAALKSANATCWPQANAWFADPFYQRGLSANGTVLRFTPAGTAAPPGSPSATTGIFVVPPYVATAGGSVKLRGPGTSTKSDLTLADVSLEEASSIAAVHVVPAAGGAAATAATFATIVSHIRTDPDKDREPQRIQATRHEWVVFGGTSFGGSYVGFFQQALAVSGF